MDEDELISEAMRRIVRKRWDKATLRQKLEQGQILKMARLRKHGYLLCAICDQGMTRDAEGNYVHVSRRHDKDHKAKVEP